MEGQTKYEYIWPKDIQPDSSALVGKIDTTYPDTIKIVRASFALFIISREFKDQEFNKGYTERIEQFEKTEDIGIDYRSSSEYLDFSSWFLLGVEDQLKARHSWHNRQQSTLTMYEFTGSRLPAGWNGIGESIR